MSSETAVITGGASGLGLVIARHPAQAGYGVVLVGRDATPATPAVPTDLQGFHTSETTHPPYTLLTGPAKASWLYCPRMVIVMYGHRESRVVSVRRAGGRQKRR
ncbi:hypothetical protein [Nonomuraea candida]|uniref:hypothetical protein n=1 Tax=Nonomuraea candida TaxID=359159 RepID=UPI0005BAC55D|nr:hypothetical protein [Nonomuraea candida]